jgi:coatomer protein complex subunit gamma
VVAAVANLMSIFGMQAHESSEHVKDKSMSHTLFLAGLFLGGHKVLVRCRMAVDPGNGVSTEVTARSADGDISMMVANAIQ